MKKLIIAFLVSCFFSPYIAAAATHEGNVITLTDKEQKACDNGGGCITAPRMALMESIHRMVEEAFSKGQESAQESLQKAYEMGIQEGLRQSQAGRT